MHQRSLLLEGLVPCAPKADGQADFRTILADPPWDVLQRGGRGAHRHYPLMTVDEIAALPIGRLASTDAHLWLWVTNATLFAGQAVMGAWGFDIHRTAGTVHPLFARLLVVVV